MMRRYHGLHIICRTGEDHISITSLLSLYQEQAHSVATMDEIKEIKKKILDKAPRSHGLVCSV